jgi:protocatechuate 3,4-dioxygenase beta subunit
MTKKRPNNLISRRDTLRLIGAAGATAIVGFTGARTTGRGRASTVEASSLPHLLAPQQTCVVRPQLTEGPYFVDERLNRSDIRTDPSTNAVSQGVSLVLRFNVSRVSGNSCTALPGAYVDIWHCDAAGNYSDISGGGGQSNTSGKKFLRGYQVTDSSGAAQFQTIYPGWYPGRATHIHFKIRLFTGSQTTYEFTSQLFFNDTLTDQVYTQAPYNTEGTRNTRNNQDGIYNGGGSQLLLDPTQEGQGYTATFNIALEGITGDTPSGGAPVVSGASVSGKQLIVTGQNFSTSARLFMNGTRQKKTANDDANPTTVLIARKAGKLIEEGQTVTLQVRNSDDTVSNEFLFTRPAG